VGVNGAQTIFFRQSSQTIYLDILFLCANLLINGWLIILEKNYKKLKENPYVNM
jgi:hypothetical protein